MLTPKPRGQKQCRQIANSAWVPASAGTTTLGSRLSYQRRLVPMLTPRPRGERHQFANSAWVPASAGTTTLGSRDGGLQVDARLSYQRRLVPMLTPKPRGQKQCRQIANSAWVPAFAGTTTLGSRDGSYRLTPACRTRARRLRLAGTMLTPRPRGARHQFANSAWVPASAGTTFVGSRGGGVELPHPLAHLFQRPGPADPLHAPPRKASPRPAPPGPPG